MKRLVAELHFPKSETASAAWQEIDRRFPFIYDAMHYHLISSAGSGVLTPTLLGVIAGGTDASQADHATAAALLAGAEDVESADIIVGAERIAHQITAHPDGEASFTAAAPDTALDGSAHRPPEPRARSSNAACAPTATAPSRNSELRQPEWREDPLPVIRSLQVSCVNAIRAAPHPDPPRA